MDTKPNRVPDSARRTPRETENKQAAGTRLIHYGATWSATADEAGGAKRNVAVLVCHGMGQQVRYETISAVAESIRNEASGQGKDLSDVEVHLSQENDGFLARAELNWKDEDGSTRCVHVYEAYWAPLTEGRVTYWDTIGFLFGAARNCFSFMLPGGNFARWIFGGPKEWKVRRRGFLLVFATLVLVVLQMAFSGYVALATVQILLRMLRHRLPIGLGFFSGAAWQTWWTGLAAGSVQRLLFTLALAGISVLVVRWIRNLIVQYAGDVAAYVSPYRDSKFDELRHKIQKVGLDVGKTIYGFGSGGGQPDYDSVIVVGHSLGSVLAYDTVNAMINLDQTSETAQRRNVLERTRALITFGSPLDKTAFIFRAQATSKEDWIREQLAAAVQPLIVSYELYRLPTFQWVNIWAPADIISGPLDYYDDPAVAAGDPRHVQNMRDTEATTPIKAHIQYFGHKLLGEQLYRFVSQ